MRISDWSSDVCSSDLWLETGRPGRIVHVASRAGHRGHSPEHWHYAAAKGGMIAMHKTIATGYADQGILSFAIAHGCVGTARAEAYTALPGGPGLLRAKPPRRGGPAEAHTRTRNLNCK